MDPTAKIPHNLASYRNITPSKRAEQPKAQSPLQRTAPRQPGASKILPTRRSQEANKLEGTFDRVIKELEQLNAETDEMLAFWSDELQQEKSTSSESSDSTTPEILRSPERPRDEASTAVAENIHVESNVEIQGDKPEAGFKRAVVPKRDRLFSDVISKRTPSSSTRRPHQNAQRELPPVDPFILARSERTNRKRGAFARSKANAAKLNFLTKKLPSGLVLDMQGNISGKYQFTKFVTPEKRRAAMADVFCEKMSEFIKIRPKPGILPPTVVGGVTVVEPVKADFHRLNYEFSTKDGDVMDLPCPTIQQAEEYRQAIDKKTLDIKTCQENLRAMQMARALRDFVQDDAASEEENCSATLVLSAVLSQKTSMLLVNAVYGPGSPLMMLSNQTTKWVNRTVSIQDRHGNKTPQDVKAFGATQFKLSADGEHFKVIVDFPWFAEARSGQEAELPLDVDCVIAVHTRAEILVDVKAARSGILSVNFVNGIEAEYSGRLKLN